MEQAENDIMSPKSHFPSYLTLALVVAGIVAGYFVFTGRSRSLPVTASPSPAAAEVISASPVPIAITTLEVEGGSFYFKPNTLTVKKGELIRIRFNSVDMMHDFVLDELEVKTNIAQSGETVEVEFAPDQVGQFEYYCSVGSHRAQGMVGTLVVTE